MFPLGGGVVFLLGGRGVRLPPGGCGVERVRPGRAGVRASSARRSSVTAAAVSSGRSAASRATVVVAGSSSASPAAVAATGPPPGGSSRVVRTPSGSGPDGPTTIRWSASATAASTRCSIGRPPTGRAGLSTPPIRRAAPPARTTAAYPVTASPYPRPRPPHPGSDRGLGSQIGPVPGFVGGFPTLINSLSPKWWHPRPSDTATSAIWCRSSSARARPGRSGEACARSGGEVRAAEGPGRMAAWDGQQTGGACCGSTSTRQARAGAGSAARTPWLRRSHWRSAWARPGRAGVDRSR